MNIDRNNYESFFLLYLDGELNVAEQAEVENFLSTHADLQKEFSLLQYTILQPTEISFEPKEMLYRKEEKRKIIPLWTRIAVALLLVLAAGWFLFNQVSSLKRTRSINEQKVIAKGPKKNQPVVVSPAKENQIRRETAASTDLTLQAAKLRELNKRPVVRESKPETAKSEFSKQHETPEIKNQNEAEDEIVAMEKSRATPDLQASGTLNAEVGSGQWAGVSKTPSIVIAVAEVNHLSESENEQPTGFPTDNAISVIALNEQNKGITSFFKKITKKMPGNETAENTKKLRVSVFQFSY